MPDTTSTPQPRSVEPAHVTPMDRHKTERFEAWAFEANLRQPGIDYGQRLTGAAIDVGGRSLMSRHSRSA